MTSGVMRRPLKARYASNICVAIWLLCAFPCSWRFLWQRAMIFGRMQESRKLGFTRGTMRTKAVTISCTMVVLESSKMESNWMLIFSSTMSSVLFIATAVSGRMLAKRTSLSLSLLRVMRAGKMRACTTLDGKMLTTFSNIFRMFMRTCTAGWTIRSHSSLMTMSRCSVVCAQSNTRDSCRAGSWPACQPWSSSAMFTSRYWMYSCRGSALVLGEASWGTSPPTSFFLMCSTATSTPVKYIGKMHDLPFWPS
mmetsp:Transcript_21861/g.54966  ORF Transcript_21861/g.54966 Transcript_21861/m.54966 type:complete len:252 (-) Transcript_21861:2424-3179(-)